MRLNQLIFIALIGLFPFYNLVAGEDSSEEADKPTLAYHELKPSLVTNLPKGAKYLRCDIQLLTTAATLIENIALHAPALRHELLMLLSEQDGKSLKSAKGKEKLRKTALAAIRKVMQEQTGKETVDQLFFTAFFVQ